MGWGQAGVKFSEAYSLYNLFLKFEHFSATSKMLLNTNGKDDYYRFLTSANLIFHSSLICLIVLELEKQIKDYSKCFDILNEGREIIHLSNRVAPSGRKRIEGM